MTTNLALAGALAATLAFGGALLDDHSSDFDVARDLEDAQAQAQATHAYEAKVQQLCGENAGWMQLEDGVIQCYTHRGAKTITVTLRSAP